MSRPGYLCQCESCRGERPPAACPHTADMFPELERVKPRPKRAELKRGPVDPAQRALFPPEEV